MADAAATSATPPPKAGFGTRVLFGLGSIAFGIKDNGFQTVLLLFYNQVVGLPAQLVGLAILLALFLDAFIDPIVGQISDNIRTPWGRRHPFMYFSAIPLGLSYLLLWNPPHASQEVQFFYLLIVSIIVRACIALYEAPSQALAPELTSDYQERTALLGTRVFFAWFGGLAMYFLAFAVLLKPDATHPVGQLNPVGYLHYGWVAGAAMTVSILVSALGTHSRIKTFTVAAARPKGERNSLKEMFAALSHKSFMAILASNLFSAAATGVAFSMNLYFYTYFWELSAVQISIFAVVNLGSALISVWLASFFSRRNKRRSAIILFVGGLAISVAPMVLRLLGAFPENGAPNLFPFLLGFSFVGLAPMISASILGYSMIADVVEDNQLRTGRRSEGLFFAANSFVLKAVSGLGVFLSGVLLAVVHFPQATAMQPGASVDPAIVRNLALLYLPTVLVLYLLAAACLAGYRITREKHEENLRTLANS